MRFPALLTGIAVSAAVLFTACSKQTETSAPPKPMVVGVTPVTYSGEPVPVRVAGIASRVAEAELSFKTGGIIEEVRVRAGDKVKKGDVLARLRQDEMEAQVVQARSALEKASRDLDRIQRLREGNVATVENAQDAATAVDVAAATLRVAAFNREHAQIVAPTDGRILRRAAEPNELAGPGKTILSFGSDTEGWLVRAGLSERDLSRVRLGDRAVVLDDGRDGRAVTGSVRHIAESTDPATRTTEVEIALDEAVPGARSGSVVAVRLHPQAEAERPVVDPAALIEGSDRRAFLFLLEKGSVTVRRVAVVVAAFDGERVYLSTDLPRDAEIVTAGAEYLRDGMEVERASSGT